MTARRSRQGEYLTSLPSVAWLTILFVAPTLMVFAMALKPVDPYGGIGAGWTLETLRGLRNPAYPAMIGRTVWISLAATAICILLAVPMGYHMARVSRRWRQALLLLTVVPFWTSFLIRVFAWKHLLHPEGALRSVLVTLGVLAPDRMLLYTPGAVLLVTIYTFLPFAVLPVYAAADKFDFQLFEAAMDLGATRLQAFWRVFLPGIRRGIITALLVVFIPALGSYVIPDVVGGPDSDMIGNKIAQRTFVDRNLPHASALAALLTLAVLLPMVGVVVLRGRGTGQPVAVREGA